MELQHAATKPSTSVSYLQNVAEALRYAILPELNGTAKDRLNECVTIIARVMSDMTNDAPPPPAALCLKDSWESIAGQEGDMLDAAAVSFNALKDKLWEFNPARDSRCFSAEKLAAYLARHPKGGPGTILTKSQLLAGGRSKQTVLVEQTGAHDLPEELVVRQDWSSAVTGTSVVTEFELLSLIAASGLKAPVPLLIESDPEVLGSPFMVVQRMSGKPQGDIFNPPPSESLALDLAEQLARLHRLPVDAFDKLGVPTDAFTREQLRQGLAGFRQIHATIGIVSPSVDVALDWLEAEIPHVTGDRALVHNDLGCHNFLIEDERLTALLDWELANIGNPAADLGYIRNFVSKMTDWDRFMQTYEEAGGPKIVPATLDFYAVWCAVRLFCLLMRARAGVTMGLVHDTEITYACAHFIPQQLQVLSKELRGTLGK